MVKRILIWHLFFLYISYQSPPGFANYQYTFDMSRGKEKKTLSLIKHMSRLAYTKVI